MANKDNLLAYPIVEELAYRANIDAKQLNTMLRSIEESVLRSVLRGNQISDLVSRLAIGVDSSYRALDRQNQIYNTYPKPIDLPSGEYGGVMYATAFGSVEGGRQDSIAGIVTMPWADNKKTSKIPIYDGTPSPAISIYVDDELRNQDDPVYNIIDDDQSTFWCEATTSGTHTIELRLPPSISKTFNYFEVIPFPVFGMNITDIEYYDNQSTPHSIYPTMDNPFYNSGGPLVFHLAPKEFNNTIKITFEVPSGINAMGFSKIDVSSIDYNNNTSTVYLKFENVPIVDHNGLNISNISPRSVDLDFFIDGVLDENYNSFISEVSLVGSPGGASLLTLQRKRGSQITPIDGIFINGSPNELWLKIVMNEVSLTSPMIRGAKLNYREV